MPVWCKYLGNVCLQYKDEQHVADSGAAYCTGHLPGIGRIRAPCPYWKTARRTPSKRATHVLNLSRFMSAVRQQQRTNDIERLERLEIDLPKLVKRRRVGSTSVDFEVGKVA